jgi:hypothetical protein
VQIFRGCLNSERNYPPQPLGLSARRRFEVSAARDMSAHGIRRSIMKMTIEIECTADEARRFFGLPDVAPMQAAFMEEVQKRIAAEMERLSSETVMRNWMPFSFASTEQLHKFFSAMAPNPPSSNQP